MKKVSILLVTAVVAFGGKNIAQAQTEQAKDGKSLYFSGVVTDKNSSGYRFQYDLEDKLRRIDNIKGGKITSWDSIFYNEEGKVYRIDKFLNFEGGEPKRDTRFEYEYDQLGQLSKRLCYMIQFEKPITTADIKFDDKGRIASYYDHTAQAKEKYDYDEHGNLIKMSHIVDAGVYGEGTSETMTSCINYTYNEKNQRIKEELFPTITDPNNLVSSSITSYEYDNDGCLSKIVQQNRNAKGDLYDAVEVRMEYNKKIADQKIGFPEFPLDLDSPYSSSKTMLFGKTYQRIGEAFYAPGTSTPVYRRVYEYKYPTSVNSVETNKIKLSLFPNPATDHLTIDGAALQNITLLRADGATVASFKVDADRVVVPVFDLERGLYIVQVKALGTVVSSKVILQ